MRKEFFSRNIFNKYFIGGVLVIFAVLAILVANPLSFEQSADIAFAEDEIPTSPTAEIKFARKSSLGTPEALSLGSFVVDV